MAEEEGSEIRMSYEDVWSEISEIDNEIGKKKKERDESIEEWITDQKRKEIEERERTHQRR